MIAPWGQPDWLSRPQQELAPYKGFGPRLQIDRSELVADISRISNSFEDVFVLAGHTVDGEVEAPVVEAKYHLWGFVAVFERID